MHLLFVAGLAASAVLMAGCSELHFPGVYRIDIEQGNLVDEDMLSTLKDGMTADQVKFVMGAPQLIDPFEPDRWVYLYRLRRGNGEIVQNRVQLWFANGVLVRHEGQALPESVRNRYKVSDPKANDTKNKNDEKIDEPQS